jgi:hypothetical protein
LPHIDGYFAPTDVAFDSGDNIYISDGYINSRVAKFDKHGNWIKSWAKAMKAAVLARKMPPWFADPQP